MDSQTFTNKGMSQAEQFSNFIGIVEWNWNGIWSKSNFII